MHKEEAVKSRNKHLQSGRFVLRVIARFYISCGISSSLLGQCSKAFTTLSVANVQEPRFSQIASAGAFVIIVTEKLTTDLAKDKSPPIRI